MSARGPIGLRSRWSGVGGWSSLLPGRDFPRNMREFLILSSPGSRSERSVDLALGLLLNVVKKATLFERRYNTFRGYRVIVSDIIVFRHYGGGIPTLCEAGFRWREAPSPLGLRDRLF